jgi:hypothetical protein
MIARTRFFVASLWAALAPVGMLVAVAVWIILFPGMHDYGSIVRRAGGLALIGVPFGYTAVVVATYAIGRGLYELRVLSRVVLVAVYAVLAVLGAGALTWWLAAGDALDILHSFALFLALGLVAAGSTAFVWWRVASREGTEPGAPGSDQGETRVRVRRRKRKSFAQRLVNKL